MSAFDTINALSDAELAATEVGSTLAPGTSDILEATVEGSNPADRVERMKILHQELRRLTVQPPAEDGDTGTSSSRSSQLPKRISVEEHVIKPVIDDLSTCFQLESGSLPELNEENHDNDVQLVLQIVQDVSINYPLNFNTELTILNL
jgi:hypothetical protein